MCFVTQILQVTATKWVLGYFGDIHRSIGESWELKQPVRPSFLLKRILLASETVLAIYKITMEVSSSSSKYKG